MKKKLIGLVAIWLAIAFAVINVGSVSSYVTVTFNADGGTGRMPDQQIPYGEPTSLNPNQFTRTGHTFVGWETRTGSGDLQFSDEDSVTLYSDMELFAIWEENETTTTTTTTPRHRCTSKCDVCHRCEDLSCKKSACRDKCLLLTMDFDDVDEDAWYADSVAYVYHHSIMQGLDENTFGVNDSTTRAMIVTMIWRLEGAPNVNVPIKFNDVHAEFWYSEAVRWAASEGIVIGITEELFAPEQNITREQMAAIIYRYAQYKKTAPEGAWAIRLDYPDLDKVSGYASEAVMYCTLKNLMIGRDNGNFEPQSDATRAEIAVLFHRFCENG